MAKEYRLLKDTIEFKAGTVFEYREQEETKDFIFIPAYYPKGVKTDKSIPCYLAIHVENRPEWFEEVKGEQILSPINDQTLSWDRKLYRFVASFSKTEDKNLEKKEPNYLITSFRFIKGKRIWKIHSNGLYGPATGGLSTLEDMFKDPPSVENGSIEIYSVKNSTGEEFTIGEEIGTIAGKYRIYKFNLIGDFIICNLMHSNNNIGGTSLGLEHILKVKTLLFTTTDGVEMFEGEDRKIYLLKKNSFDPGFSILSEPTLNWEQRDTVISNRFFTFTTKENRDKYIKENTIEPIFISADGIKYYDPFNMDCNLFSVHPISWEEKRTKVKNCAAQHSEWLHFHTKEARQKYIDNNKILDPAVVGGDYHIITHDKQDIVIGTQDLFSVFINRKEKRFDITKYDKSLTYKDLQEYNTSDHLWFAIQENAVEFCCTQEDVIFENNIVETSQYLKAETIINERRVLSINDIFTQISMSGEDLYKLRNLVKERTS